MSLIDHSRARLSNRFKIEGNLIFDTGFHLGGGQLDFSATDSPVVRDGERKPFIPGSSIKGAFRTAVERLAPAIQLSSCGIFDKSARCLTPQEESDAPRKAYREVREALYQRTLDEMSKQIDEILRWSGNTNTDLKGDDKITEEHLLSLLDYSLCDVCKAFGAPFLGSSVFFHDVYLDEAYWLGATQIRDGVGIDRDSGRAVDKVKYDYEVVPSQTVFRLSMTVESNNPVTLGLVALGLHELRQGNIPLGGIKSRGLGRCRLDEEQTKIEAVALGTREALVAYLLEGKTTDFTLSQFIEDNLKKILGEGK